MHIQLTDDFMGIHCTYHFVFGSLVFNPVDRVQVEFKFNPKELPNQKVYYPNFPQSTLAFFCKCSSWNPQKDAEPSVVHQLSSAGLGKEAKGSEQVSYVVIRKQTSCWFWLG